MSRLVLDEEDLRAYDESDDGQPPPPDEDENDEEGDDEDADEDNDDEDEEGDGPDMDQLELDAIAQSPPLMVNPPVTGADSCSAPSTLSQQPQLLASSSGPIQHSAAVTKIVPEKEKVDNKPQFVECVEALPSQIHLIVSPFPGRVPSVSFQAADRPIMTDPRGKEHPQALVIPSQVGNLHTATCPVPPPQTGTRKRIGRKNKFGKMLFFFPEGAVRFSSVLSILKMSGFAETVDQDAPWSVRWAKRVEPEEYAAMKPYQKVNHFPGTWSIGRKDNLHKRLTSRLRRYGQEAYGFFPQGFLLPEDRLKLKDAMEQVKKIPPLERKDTDGLYILKPVASACGRGVRMLTGPPKRSQKGLVQAYVDDPLLIHGYKFDLRIYVVVTCYDPLRVYVYNDGLVRFASTPYPTALSGEHKERQEKEQQQQGGQPPAPTAGGGGGGKKSSSSGASRTNRLMLKRKTAHLTNYSVNKKNAEEFVTPDDAKEAAAAEKASKWTLSAVRDYFNRTGLPWGTTWARIEDLIIKTLLCAEPDVASATRRVFPSGTGTRASGFVKNCFELYGFDVLLKRDLSPILMEVNIMPSLSTRCSLLDQRVKANMIADMLTLAGGYSATRKAVRPKYGQGSPSSGSPVSASPVRPGTPRRRGSITSSTPKSKQRIPTPPPDPTTGDDDEEDGSSTPPPSGSSSGPKLQSPEFPSFLQELGADLQEMVMLAEEEYDRCMNFKRIFPTTVAYDVYKPYFAEHRGRNLVMQTWEQHKQEEYGVERWSQVPPQPVLPPTPPQQQSVGAGGVPIPSLRGPAGGSSLTGSASGGVRGRLPQRTPSAQLKRPDSATKNNNTVSSLTGTFGAPPPLPNSYQFVQVRANSATKNNNINTTALLNSGEEPQATMGSGSGSSFQFIPVPIRSGGGEASTAQQGRAAGGRISPRQAGGNTTESPSRKRGVLHQVRQLTRRVAVPRFCVGPTTTMYPRDSSRGGGAQQEAGVYYDQEECQQEGADEEEEEE